MPAFVTLSNLSAATPDGTPLFSDLTFSFGAERTGLVGRNGTGKTTLLRLIAGSGRPRRGSVHVKGRIGWLQQTLSAPPGRTIADLFNARAALAVMDRAEAGTASADDLATADWTLSSRISATLARLGLTATPETPLTALSGGERTRAALAALILDAPDLLMLDEPTNNLDAEGRAAVRDLLHGWQGAAIVVSHDRALLEEMDAIVELAPKGATRYGGPYSHYETQSRIAQDAAAQALIEAEKARNEAATRARIAAERKARKGSAGRKFRATGSQGKILLDAAKGRAEASSGAEARLREARAAEADTALAAARARVEVHESLRMELPPTNLPSRRTVLRLDTVTGGPDPQAPVIRDLSLTVTGPERIAVTGPNGSGKTTLLSLIQGSLTPQAGTADLCVPHALLDQQAALLDPGQTLRDNFHRLNPKADETTCRAALARFRFRADDALQIAGTFSEGSRLRAALACTLGREDPPQLLMLDEPTNHLDLAAIEALEAALRGYDGALIVVSHDPVFLDRIGIERWVTMRPLK